MSQLAARGHQAAYTVRRGSGRDDEDGGVLASEVSCMGPGLYVEAVKSNIDKL
jgi:hypothetical protein